MYGKYITSKKLAFKTKNRRSRNLKKSQEPRASGGIDVDFRGILIWGRSDFLVMGTPNPTSAQESA